MVHPEAEGQVEVTIVEGPIPSYADLMPAHQSLYRFRVKRLSKEAEVVFLRVLTAQLRPKSSQRHVRNGEESVKPDAEALAKLSPVVFFKG